MDRQQLIQKVRKWSKKELNKEILEKDLLELFEGEHGVLFMKMYNILSDHAVSRKTSEQMAEAVKAYSESKKIEELQEDAKRLVAEHQNSSSVFTKHTSPANNEISKNDEELFSYLSLFDESIQGMLKYINRLESASDVNAQELKDLIKKLSTFETTEIDFEKLKQENRTISGAPPEKLAKMIDEKLDMVEDLMDELKTRVNSAKVDQLSEGIESYAAHEIANHNCPPFVPVGHLSPEVKSKKCSFDSLVNKKSTLNHLYDQYVEKRKDPQVRYMRKLRDLDCVLKSFETEPTTEN